MEVNVVRRRLSDSSFVYDVRVEQGLGGNSVTFNMESESAADRLADLLDAACVGFEIG